MATLLDGYTQNGKHLTVDLSKQSKLSDTQIEALNKYGYTYSYINEPSTSTSTGSSNTNTNNNYNPLPDAGYTGGSSGGSSGGGKIAEPPKTWENYWSKMNNPAEISKYLNGQSGFVTKVVGDRIVGTKNGVKKVWKFDGTNWVSEDQKGWDYYAKLNDPNEVAFYLNSQDGFDVKVAGTKITGTKNGVQSTWSFNGADWVASATAQDTAGKNNSAATSAANKATEAAAGATMNPAETNTSTTDSKTAEDTSTKGWESYASNPDAVAVTTYLNTQPGFQTQVMRDPTTNEVVPNKIEGTKNGVKTTWTFDGSNWKNDNPTSEMQTGAVTTENITTAQLNKMLQDRGIDPTTFTGKQKAAYDRLVIKAQENDKKSTDTTKTETDTNDELSDTEKQINDMLDGKKDINQVLIDTAKEGVKIIKEKIENVTKPMQEEYDKLSAEWANQEATFQGQFDRQWADVAKYESESLQAIQELENLGRQQYKDYVTRVARVISGRKAGIAGDLSAQGFNSNIINNITSQVDSQYADERLKAQNFLQTVLDQTLSRHRDLYTDLYNRRSSLTAAQQSFRTLVGERYKYLSGIKQKIGELVNSMFEPIENINKTLTGAITPVAESAAKTAAYEAEWTKGDENTRISQLSSQLHNFIGAEKNPDGTAKYDTNKIPTEKLAEFAKLPTAAEAYRAAVDYLIRGEAAVATDSSTPATSTSTGTSSTGAKKTNVGDTNVPKTESTPASVAGTDSLTTSKTYLLNQARLLERHGGFAKTNTSYAAFESQLNNAKSKEDLDKLASLILPAVTATPQVATESKLSEKKKEAFAPYSSLSEAQKTVVKKSPLMKDVLAITQEIQNLTKDDERLWNVGTLGRAKLKLKKVIAAALAGQTNVDLTSF